uniref:Hexosyltransferase n=1 Tax=Alexandrium catenella TaxID=2925 RepID=A0A7S1LBH4_ALECA
MRLARALLWVLALFTPEGCGALREARQELREATRLAGDEAYAFMIYGQESHQIGLLTAIFNIREFDKEREIVVLTPESNEAMEKDLAKLNAKVLVRPTIPGDACIGKVGLGKSRLVNSFFKLHVWNLTQYNTVLYLESDMLIREPLDYIFRRSRLMAGKEALMIAPQGHKDCTDGNFHPSDHRRVWNTGIMGIRPSSEFARAYLDMVLAMNAGNTTAFCEGGSQSLENVLFASKMQNQRGWSHLYCLPLRYNCKDVVCVENAAVVHWTGEHKPWDGGKGFDQYVPDWVEMRGRAKNATGVGFSREVLDSGSERSEPTKNMDATFMEMARQLMRYHDAVLDLIS